MGKNLVVIAKILVDSGQRLVCVDIIPGYACKVYSSRLIGQWEIRSETYGDGIQPACRNDIAGKRLSIERIRNGAGGRGKIASALRRRECNAGAGGLLPGPQSLATPHKKCH